MRPSTTPLPSSGRASTSSPAKPAQASRSWWTRWRPMGERLGRSRPPRRRKGRRRLRLLGHPRRGNRPRRKRHRRRRQRDHPPPRNSLPGKGRVFVNNQPATVAVLKQLAPELALVHAQTETLTSFDQAQQRILLDRFAGISTDAVAEAHARSAPPQQKLNELVEGEQDRLRMVDLWSYQRKEIEAARLDRRRRRGPRNRKARPRQCGKTLRRRHGRLRQLYEGSSSAEVALRAAVRNVEELARYDTRFADAALQLDFRPRHRRRRQRQACATTPKASTPRPSGWPRSKTASPLIDRLKRKYGKTIAEVIAFGEDVTHKLAEVEDKDEILKALRADLETPPRLSRPPPPRFTRSAKPPPQSWPSWPKRRSTRSP